MQWSLIGLLLLGLANDRSPAAERASLPEGITVAFVPDHVHPGDLCQLLVTLDRSDYACFEWTAPIHSRLHRVALENRPLEYVNGRYRQSASVHFQAVASGRVSIDDLTLHLTDRSGTRVVDLPNLALEVLPFDQPDLSDDPAELAGSARPPQDPSWVVPLLIMLTLGVLVLLAIFYRLTRRDAQRSSTAEDTVPCLAMRAIEQLQSGCFPRDTLTTLLVEHESVLSQGLITELEQAIFGRQHPESTLAARLRQELLP